jgi:hypothetical protein
MSLSRRFLAWLAAGMTILAAIFAVAGMTSPAAAKSAVSCGGAVLLNGTELLCSHVDPKEPEQFCTFSWALATLTNQMQVVQGSFLLPPGASNIVVYQGGGFTRAMSEPIVLCQGKRHAQ